VVRELSTKWETHDQSHRPSDWNVCCGSSAGE